MSCLPCAICGTGCGSVQTPEGLACKECADELSLYGE